MRLRMPRSRRADAADVGTRGDGGGGRVPAIPPSEAVAAPADRFRMTHTGGSEASGPARHARAGRVHGPRGPPDRGPRVGGPAPDVEDRRGPTVGNTVVTPGSCREGRVAADCGEGGPKHDEGAVDDPGALAGDRCLIRRRRRGGDRRRTERVADAQAGLPPRPARAGSSARIRPCHPRGFVRVTLAGVSGRPQPGKRGRAAVRSGAGGEYVVPGFAAVAGDLPPGGGVRSGPATGRPGAVAHRPGKSAGARPGGSIEARYGNPSSSVLRLGPGRGPHARSAPGACCGQ
ncbi:hypothetical protein GA0115246_110195 [Streptomyces sp. SolWspMP-sol7th]|nr:hypothetical protein GA0115246_110195 [Streptomyces sp. SolWspMP-sol7th]